MDDRVVAFPWQELGISPTRDRRTIRLAYAARLKAIDAERDPAAFRRLRAAYEAALRAVARTATGPAGAEPPPPPPPASAADPIRERLHRGDLAGAVALLQTADAADALPFSTMRELEAAMLEQAAATPGPPPALLRDLVGRFGWDQAALPLRAAEPSLFARLDRRLDAERWYAELVDRAAARSRPLRPDSRRFAARLMLRGPPRWYEWFGPADWRLLLGTPRYALTQVLQQLALHEEWIGGRFDAARIRWCRRRIRPGPLLILYIMGFGSVVPVIAIVEEHQYLPALAAWSASAVSCAIAWTVVWAARKLQRR